MPKYFEGSIELSLNRIVLSVDEVTEDVLNERIDEEIDYALSIKFSGLSEQSLGYIFFIHKNENLFTMKDIKGVILFNALSIDQLVTVLRHASGIEYSDEIQSEFHRIRNEIGIQQ